MQSTLSDESLMPFGKYKGTKMANVPASYLIWIYENNRAGNGAVFKYIAYNMDSLLLETKQGKK